jgi:hypothetical protein
MILSLSAQPAGGIGGGGHGGSVVIARGIRGDIDRGGLRNAGAGVQLEVIFAAGGAVAFACFVVAQAGQLIASADAVAVAGFGSRLNRNERHRSPIVRSLWILCKYGPKLAQRCGRNGNSKLRDRLRYAGPLQVL